MSDTTINVSSNKPNTEILDHSNPALYSGVGMNLDEEGRDLTTVNTKPKRTNSKKFMKKRTEESFRADNYDIKGKTAQQLIDIYNKLSAAQKTIFLQQLAKETPEKLGQMYFAISDPDTKADFLKAIALNTPANTFSKIYGTLSAAQQDQFFLEVIVANYGKLTPDQKNEVDKIVKGFFNEILDAMPQDDKKLFLTKLADKLQDIEKKVTDPEQKKELQDFITNVNKDIQKNSYHNAFDNIDNVMMIIIKVFAENMNVEGLDEISQINDTKIMNNYLDIAQQVLKDNLGKQQDLVNKINNPDSGSKAAFWIGIALIVVFTVVTMGFGAPAADAAVELATVAAEDAVEEALTAAVEKGATDALADTIADGMTSTVTKDVVENAAKDVVENTAKDAIENAATTAAKDAVKDAAGNALSDAAKTTIENAATTAAKNAATQAAKESLRKTIYQAVRDAVRKAVLNEIKGMTKEVAKEYLKKVAKEAAEKALTDGVKAAAKTAAETAAETAAKDVVVNLTKIAADNGGIITKEAADGAINNAVLKATQKSLWNAVKQFATKWGPTFKTGLKGVIGCFAWYFFLKSSFSTNVPWGSKDMPMSAADSANLGVYQSVSTLANNVVNQDTNNQQVSAKRMSDDSERINQDYGFMNQAINLFGQAFSMRA